MNNDSVYVCWLSDCLCSKFVLWLFFFLVLSISYRFRLVYDFFVSFHVTHDFFWNYFNILSVLQVFCLIYMIICPYSYKNMILIAVNKHVLHYRKHHCHVSNICCCEIIVIINTCRWCSVIILYMFLLWRCKNFWPIQADARYKCINKRTSMWLL